MVLLAIHGRFWSFHFHCLLSALLCGSNMCTQVSSPVNKLKITQLVQPFHVFKSSQAHLRHCVLLLSEQMKYPPSANLSQVQTLFQNCLHTAFWYTSTTSYIFDRQSRILFDHNLYSNDVSLGNRGFRPCRTGIIFQSSHKLQDCLTKNGRFSFCPAENFNLSDKCPVISGKKK